MKNLKDEDKISALEELKKTIGWQIIVEVLEVNIQDSEKRMKDKMFSNVNSIKLEDIKDVNILNEKRKDRIELKNLPDTLIKIYQLKDGTKKDFDAYE